MIGIRPQRLLSDWGLTRERWGNCRDAFSPRATGQRRN